MSRRRLLVILALALLIPTVVLATHPNPLPDTITTPNFGYTVWFTDNNPPPTPDANYFPAAQAQNIANALNTNATPTPGAPNGYHTGYTNLGFLAPDFDGGNRDVFVFDCTPHGGCDSGDAPADRIRMPAPSYRNQTEACIRLVIGHELFHHVQYAYITFGKWSTWGSVPVEGTARLMQDKVYSDLDANAGCITYRNEVNNYLGNPNRTMWNIAYTTALFWNYLMEQLGTTTTEPQVGVDFIRRFWQNAQANNSSPDTVATLRQTIRDFDVSATLEGMFHDFTIANYTKDLDVSGLADGLKYRYVDENDGTSGSYQQVARTWSGTIPPKKGPQDDSVVRWGARYYQATIGANCTGVVGFLAEPRNDKTAAYSLIAVTGTNDVARIYKSVSKRFARALIQRPGNPYTRLAAVVAGLNDKVDFRYTFDCGGADLTIIRPTSSDKAYVGDPAAPDRFLVRVRVYGPSSLGTPSVEGLEASDFEVYVGAEAPANQATVLSGAYVQGDYWLVVQAPTKSTKGTYPLLVKLGTLASDTNKGAVVYEKRVLDQVLVIDRSGSMLSPAGYPKLTAAKNAASLFVDAANSNDKLGVVSFGGDNVEPNDDAILHTMLQDVTDAQRNAARTAIQGLSTTPNVLTSIGDGLEKARGEFTLRGSALGQDWIVLLSDGMENEALFWSNVRAAILAAGIKVNAIALGPYTDQPLMQAIAKDTGGTYYYVDVPTGSFRTDALSAVVYPRRLYDAYASAFERIRRHERIWEAEGTLGRGASRTFNVFIGEGGIEDGRISISWPDPAAPIDVEIRRPDGSLVQDGVAGARVFKGSTYVVAHVGTVASGSWQIRVRALRGATAFLGIFSGWNRQGASLDVYFAEYHDDTTLLNKHGLFLRGLPMPILATLTDSKGPIAGAVVSATVEHPDGTTLVLPLLDDGSHGDGNADDGIYGNLYTRTTVASETGQPDDPGRTPPKRGSYNVRVQATGVDNLGDRFHRIRKAAFQVFEGESEKQVHPDQDEDGMPTRYELLHPCLDPATPDARVDPDRDGLPNGVEYETGTDPCDADTDRGGESDGSEVARRANPFDPRDDVLPQPIDVEVVDWIPDHMPRLPLRPNSNLIRFPLNRAYTAVLIYRSTSPGGPFRQIATVPTARSDGFYRDGGLVNGRTYYYYVQGEGTRGHLSAPSHVFSGTPKADPFPPIGSVLINHGQAYVETRWVTLDLQADSDTKEMLIANTSDFDGAGWEAYTPTKSWRLDPVDGYAAVFVKYRDAAGNESIIYSDDIRVTGRGTLGSIRLRVVLDGLENFAGVFATLLGTPDATPSFSDAEGTVLLSPILPGSYDVLLERPGFLPRILKDIRVSPGEPTEIGEIPLEVQPFTTYVPVVLKP